MEEKLYTFQSRFEIMLFGYFMIQPILIFSYNNFSSNIVSSQ